jgi:hypothetical protein
MSAMAGRLVTGPTGVSGRYPDMDRMHQLAMDVGERDQFFC